MSRPSNWWLPNVINAIKAYPSLKERKNELQSMNIIANYSGMPRGGGESRTIEGVALRQLSKAEEEAVWAVERAIYTIDHQECGDEVLTVVKYRYWQGCHNLEEAVYKMQKDGIYISERTAQRRMKRFVMAVARNLNYC